MDIKVLLTGFKADTSIITINERATINTLFQKIGDITGIDLEYLRISFKGKEIDPKQHGDKSLTQFGIKEKNSLQLISRVHGGMLHRMFFSMKVQRTKEPDIILYDDDQSTWRYKMPCGHVMSREGMKSYCNDEVKHLQYEIKCPDPSCGSVWDTELVRYVAGMSEDEEVEFEATIGKNYMARGKPFKNCPKCHTACERLDKKNARVVCSVCSKGYSRYEFCWHCNGTWQTSNTRQCGNAHCTGEDPSLTKLRQCRQTKLQGMEGNFPKIRACPECHSMIEHIGGCKQMDCKFCKTKFCFICLKKATGKNYQCGGYNTRCDIAPVQEYLFQ